MPAKRTLQVLFAVVVLTALSALVVRATHDPQASDVVAVATSNGMTCKTSANDVQCSALDFDGTWSELASITPASADLVALYTEAAVSPSWAPPLYSSFRTWLTDMQAVPCNGVTRELAAFVANVSNLTTDGTLAPMTITAECNLTGGLRVVRNSDGFPSEYDYWINSAVIAPPTPTPSPTPTPTPTPTPSPTPTRSPSPSPTPTSGGTASGSPTGSPSATPTATGAASGSESASASASSSETVSGTLSQPAQASSSPEQGIGGGTGTPSEPSPGSGVPAGDQGWTTSVPSPDKVSTKPIDLASSLALALLLMFAMAFPGELFNNTVQANYDEIAGWFGGKKKS